MKVLYHLYLLAVVVSSEFVPSEYHPWKRTQLTAVTHFKNFEQFYMREMRLQKPRSSEAERYHPDETAEVKRTLCDKILSHHDSMDKEFVLKLDVGNVRRDLRRDDARLYEEIFLPPKIGSSAGMCCVVGSAKPRYVNPYVSIDANVHGEIVTEFVFKCLARNLENRHIIQYYISEEYNVNIRRTKVNGIQPRYIAGRFVFSQDADDEWRLVEMAEESAILTALDERDSYEKLYLRYRKKQKIVEDPAHDPVCGLDPAQKLRLCVSVMNTSKMTGRGKTPQFLPKYHNFKPETQRTDTECIQREVITANDHHTYKEWTISCHVETLPQTETNEINIETFIVSRGYRMNSVFVFRFSSDENIMVDHHSFNVSVVDDPTVYTQPRGAEPIVI